MTASVRFPGPATWAWVAAFFALAACGGSSATTTLGPTPVRCDLAVSPASLTFGADGGSTRVTITTERDCTWSVRSEASWLAVQGAASGQGSATLTVSAAANPDPAARQGAVTVGERRVAVSQQAAPCRFQVSPLQADVGAAGGTVAITLSTHAECSWNTVSRAGWLTVAAGASGRGSGEVRVTVAANGGAARTGTVDVGGSAVTIQQAAASGPAPPPAPEPEPEPTCNPTVSPTSLSIGASGGEATVQVSVPAGCTWTARSHADWLTITAGSSGTGNGQVRVAVAANAGGPRTGTLTVAGRTVTVEQAGRTEDDDDDDGDDDAGGTTCSYSLSTTSIEVRPRGGRETIRVRTGNNCEWTARIVQGTEWITFRRGESGKGDGRVEIEIAANTGGPRVGTLLVAGQTVTVSQLAASLEVDLQGPVGTLRGHCPTLAFGVRSTAVRTDSATNFRHGACGDLRNGTQVNVRGQREPEAVLATRVELLRDRLLEDEHMTLYD